jgi:hypothetical protein
MKPLQWPYTLPIWRDFYRAVSPDGQRVAQIDPAREVSMGNPTFGLLCVTGGPHLDRCNPSFVWSDDSRYLAVPQFYGFFNRQRLLIIAFAEKRVFASRETTWYFQPESFSGGQLIVTIEPFRRSARPVTFHIPSELATRFQPLKWRDARWPQSTG